MKRKKGFFSCALLSFVTLVSCGSSTPKNYSGVVYRTETTNNTVFDIVDYFALELNKGKFTLIISSFSYSANTNYSSLTGKRVIERYGVYSTSGENTATPQSPTTLDVPLAEQVRIEQTGQGFPELAVQNQNSAFYIDTNQWTSAMETENFITPLSIREAFGHPAYMIVSSSPSEIKGGDFSIIKYPAIFVAPEAGK